MSKFEIRQSNFGRMKRAILVSMDKKKDAQIKQDIDLGPRGRFYKMFDLISLSIKFSPQGRLRKPHPQNAVELKRRT